MNLKGKKVLVLGLGESGLSMTKWLTRQGANVRIADSRTAPPAMDALKAALPKVAVRTGAFQREDFSGIDLIAISPGVPLVEPLVQQAVERGMPVVGDIELFALALKQINAPRPKVLAITGSNGKTTVTAMVGAMVQKAGWDAEVAGNISPAVLDALMQRQDSGKLPQAWVLELSSFQLETTQSLSPDAAAVLNLSEDHFDRYPGMQDYAAAKARIFMGGGVQILNRDDALVRAMALSGRKQITFGLDTPVTETDFGLQPDSSDAGDDTWLVQGKYRLLKTSELAVSGQHNAANALAALALCRVAGLPLEPLLQALREFKGLPHRMEKVAELNGIAFYDDSKGTNVGATVAALGGMTQTAVLIVGGDGKGQDFAPLQQPVAQHARAVVLIGRDAEKIAAALADCGVPLHRVTTMEQAVQKSFALAQTGDAVLMSPACASFDMFRNYAHRAEVFVAAIRDLQTNLSAATNKDSDK